MDKVNPIDAAGGGQVRALPSAAAEPLSPAFVSGALRAAEQTLVGLCGLGAHLVYVYPGPLGSDSQYIAAVCVGIILFGSIAARLGAYSIESLIIGRTRIGHAILAWLLAFAVVLAMAFAFKISNVYSRVWAVGWLATSAAAIAISRGLAISWISAAARAGRFSRRAVIVGAGRQGHALAAHLLREGDPRLRVVGFVDDRKTRIASEYAGLKVLGTCNDLLTMIRRDLVDLVIVAIPWAAERRLRTLISDLALTPVPIRLAPDLAGHGFGGGSFAEFAGLPMLRLFDRPISGRAQLTKLLEDFVLASALLVLLAPLMAVIAAAIRLDSPGPVLFRQTRQGFNNSTIPVWKFRTMHVSDSDPSGAVQASRGDPRITRIGRILRRTSLDELPQLIDVLAGRMSLVGPRPHALATKAEGRLFEEVVHRYAARHRVKPGITGWAQVNGWRGETDTVAKIQKRVEYDLYYIDNWSIWFDLLILIRTVWHVVKADNAV